MNTMLSLRALNRATLERQMLLRRWRMPMPDAVERLVGLQAQTTHTWYHGLWTRLEDFLPERLAEMLINRQVVRIALMRSTIHLVTARDCLWLRPLTQPVIERSAKGAFGKHWIGLDIEALVAAVAHWSKKRPALSANSASCSLSAGPITLPPPSLKPYALGRHLYKYRHAASGG